MEVPDSVIDDLIEDTNRFVEHAIQYTQTWVAAGEILEEHLSDEQRARLDASIDQALAHLRDL